MTRFKAGDLFAFKLRIQEEAWMCGRIMLDVKHQCIRPKLLPSDSPLLAFNGAMLIEVYRTVSPNPTITTADVLIPGMFTDPASLQDGTWVIIGQQEVDPTSVEFPEALVHRGRQAHFQRGEISLPITLSYQEVKRLNVYKTLLPSGILHEICLYYLGRADEINDPYLQDVELRSLKHADFRFTDQRSQIYQLMGEDETLSYYEMSTHFGHELRRFYTQDTHVTSATHIRNTSNMDTIIVCPYCRSPISENTKLCPHCGEDTTHDALIEMQQGAYAHAERKLCPFCEKVLLKHANRCPHCRQHQPDNGS